MTNPKEPQDQHLAFDQMELHADINVHQTKPPPQPAPRRKPDPDKKGTSLTPLWLLLFLAAAAAAGYFYYAHHNLSLEHEKLKAEVAALANQAAETSSNLLSTKEVLENAKSDINNQKGSLQEAQTTLSSLQSDLSKAQKENTSLKLKIRSMETTVSDKDKAISAKQNELGNLQSKLTAANKQQKSLESERDNLKKELQTEKQNAETRISGLETQAQALSTDLTSKTAAWINTERQLRQQLDEANSSAKRYQAQFKGESEASGKILADLKRLNNERDDFAAKSRKAETQVRDLKERLGTLETVSVGDLVPFSENLVAATVRYREPLPEGVKIPKKMGKAVVHVLVNEIGSVEKAIVLPDELMDGTLAAALARTIYKWKFTPPSLNNVRVKAWTPVQVYPE